jgi:hypothetical protein
MHKGEGQTAVVWRGQQAAQGIIENIIEECTKRSAYLLELKKNLESTTSTHFIQWIDHLEIGGSLEFEEKLIDAGFIRESTTHHGCTFSHRGAKFPRISVVDEMYPFLGLALRVDSIADYCSVHSIHSWIDGAPGASYRKCCILRENGLFLFLVERKQNRVMEPSVLPGNLLVEQILLKEKWQMRPRIAHDEIEELDYLRHAILVGEEMAASLGENEAAHIFFHGEQLTFQVKNRAFEIQKMRQDSFGLGMQNVSHMTLRSSRRHFTQALRLMEVLGFSLREKFFKGNGFGIGTFVLEQQESGLVVLLEVDISHEEVHASSIHKPFLEWAQLGEVGLWCALHGESLLQGGPHNIGIECAPPAMESDLKNWGVSCMTLPTMEHCLHESCTVGEIWKVAPFRLHNLIKRNLMSEDKAQQILALGFEGSHLTLLYRESGYKGFYPAL